MIKAKRCQEIVTGNGKKYLFSGTIGNIEAVSFSCGDPGKLYARLCDGDLPPTEIKAIIKCTMLIVDGIDISELDLDAEVKQFIEDFGLSDCASLCMHLLSHAIIGDVKKKQLERRKKAKGMLRKCRHLILTSFARAGWLWGAILIVSIISACTIFSLKWLHIV